MLIDLNKTYSHLDKIRSGEIKETIQSTFILY